jgi:hypothetical protein
VLSLGRLSCLHKLFKRTGVFLVNQKGNCSSLSLQCTPLSLSDIRGSGRAPPRVSRKGKTPPLERGRGIHSSPANPERVTVRQAHGLSKVEGRESVGAKGQWCLLVKDINYCKANTLQRCLREDSGNF